MANESQLNINTSIVAFSDCGPTNNPSLKSFDWSRNLNGLIVYQPKSSQMLVPPRTMQSILNSQRGMLFDATTSIQASYLTGSTYRFAFNGGTDPGFATDNPLSFTNASITITTQPNQTVIMTATTSIFTGISGGSYLYIYSPIDNPSAAFNILNSGVWIVLSASGTQLTLSRPQGTTFQSFDGTVTPVSASGNMISYTLTNVQVGDMVKIGTPFSVGSYGTYTVADLTSKWIDVVSTTPIVSETVLPGIIGMTFFSSAKRYTRVEVSQNANVYFNGTSSQNDEISPWAAGDVKQMGWVERIGPVWSLSVFNLSNVPMICNVFTAE